jgi:hypothetical protein
MRDVLKEIKEDPTMLQASPNGAVKKGIPPCEQVHETKE